MGFTMAFTPKTWRNRSQGAPLTPVTAEELTRIETGVKDAHEALDGRLAKTALDQSYASLSAPAQTNTWDAATGSIKTITEHFPAPIGDRVTTYGGYNAAGDPTTETDPNGQVWTLGYDSAGNQITRTKVA